ncbi:hypothetical protein FisN_10Lu141 [Fistulifera solaris]|uniref:Uncharacterized protein n=1 Tax=Fistulifera solaris TaxID=1519565 RepID=A0A1Z5JTA2_FISSO|nr:hypothetical protein FisN_10Lu141 [Fistulifera solaris]|eukprot:GAX17264.1 hypothetical protein FisN_10Lu141 [Fistulifera solaris]
MKAMRNTSFELRNEFINTTAVCAIGAPWQGTLKEFFCVSFDVSTVMCDIFLGTRILSEEDIICLNKSFMRVK